MQSGRTGGNLSRDMDAVPVRIINPVADHHGKAENVFSENK